MTTSPLNIFDDCQWEAHLRQWAQMLSPGALGLKLAIMLRDLTPPNGQPLLDLMIQQYHQPDDARRRQIFELAKTYGFCTPVGTLALAQFWSAGSMSQDGLPPVYPEPHLSPQMLYCTLVMLVSQLADNPADGVRQLFKNSATLEVS